MLTFHAHVWRSWGVGAQRTKSRIGHHRKMAVMPKTKMLPLIQRSGQGLST